MPFDSILALTGILLAATWTPGPNNLMLASSGATFGLRATVPHIIGVFVGFGFMLFVVALGFGGVFVRFPVIQTVLRWAGAALLLWIAWRIANTKSPGEAGARTRPFTFVQAAAFQWINPKAWVMCVSLAGQFLDPAHALRSALIMALVSMASGVTSASGWAMFGQILQRWLTTPRHLRLFNYTMAGIIALGVILLLVQ